MEVKRFDLILTESSTGGVVTFDDHNKALNSVEAELADERCVGDWCVLSIAYPGIQVCTSLAGKTRSLRDILSLS